MEDGSQKCVQCEEDQPLTPETVKSGHPLCENCFDTAMQTKTCVMCQKDCKVITGDMPPGQMTTDVISESLPGNEGYGTIRINYHFSGGVQTPEQPTPGARYAGKDFIAYLPDSPEGRQVLALLKVAWDRRLTFRLSTSCWLLYSGITNATLCYNIGHKRKKDGGVMKNGYPDPGYLQRCKEELAVLGVTEEDIKPA